MSSDPEGRLQPISQRSFVKTPANSTTSRSFAGDLPPPADHGWSKNPHQVEKVRKPSSVHPHFEERELATQLPRIKHTVQQPISRASKQDTSDPSWELLAESSLEKKNPRVTVERPTPERGRSSQLSTVSIPPESAGQFRRPDGPLNKALRPTIAARRHSPIPDGHNRLFSALRGVEIPQPRSSHFNYLSENSTKASMPHRKVWVKRSGSSATQVAISEDDLVDDVRDMVIKKYANSLGRSFDPPDVTLRLVQRKYSARHSNHERALGPEEIMFRLLDMHYPGGQTVEEALIIDVPQRRTPKHSPHIAMPYYMPESLRPGENQTDYFPIMPAGPHSPQVSSSFPVASGAAGVHRQNPHAISVLETGQLPDLPSPGSRMTRHSHRPKFGRQHTSSPTVLSGSSNNQTLGKPKLSIPSPYQKDIDFVTESSKIQNSQPLPTPPLPIDTASQRVATPPPRTSSPRPSKPSRRIRKSPVDNQTSLSASHNLLDNSVPPINVLVVEDNIINLKLLEAFLKRLKVRWSTAMNGRDAVTRWREGGFHLVLMDIQLPIMNGLEATKEIRRLEKVNDIGVFTSSASSTPTFGRGEGHTSSVNDGKVELKEEDSLMNTALFKSPVIIVALTASSLQSDRHEALAAGCNDFLTKVSQSDSLPSIGISHTDKSTSP